MATEKKQRLVSIDALRGFDMIWILGAEGIFAALFMVTGWSLFDVAAGQMLHSSWHGFTAYDLIFPLFIFLSGVSIGIAGKPMREYPQDQKKLKQRRAVRRLALLFALGVLYNHGWGTGVPLSLDEIRYASVLGRIGIAWFVATLLVWYVGIRLQWVFAGGILLGYWGLLSLATIAGHGGGDFSNTGALNAWFDQTLLPGIRYQNLAIDPEGILSNLSSVVNALAGVFAGRHMIKHREAPYLLLGHFVIAGLLLLALGYAWGMVFPINKTLWTSSFVLVTLGYSLILLSIFYYLIDVLGFQHWAKFFAIIGVNSIIAYLATSLVQWKFLTASLFGGVMAAASPAWHSLLQVCLLVLVQWFFLYWLYRRNIFIKV